jgi:hypothetical protein
VSEADASDVKHVGENPARGDVERLCAHLADRVEGNGSRRPAVGKAWRDAARLMLDRDGRGEDQVHRAIDWCQDHEFWRSNVRSMPKLREQYDQLRLQAQRRPGGRAANPSPYLEDIRRSQAAGGDVLDLRGAGAAEAAAPRAGQAMRIITGETA